MHASIREELGGVKSGPLALHERPGVFQRTQRFNQRKLKTELKRLSWFISTTMPRKSCAPDDLR
eukprot:3796246-Amphidinium_carterae.1